MPGYFAVLASAALMAVAGPASGTPRALPALTGEWGGIQSRLTLFETGGRLEFGCASVALAAGIRPDATGHFRSVARYEDYSAGPTAADQPAQFVTVQLSGRVEGDVVHLDFAPKGGVAQHHVLKRGRRAKIITCN